VDVHVFTPAEFQSTVDEYLSFTWVIARQARIYYHTKDAVSRVPALKAAVNAPGVSPPDN